MEYKDYVMLSSFTFHVTWFAANGNYKVDLNVEAEASGREEEEEEEDDIDWEEGWKQNGSTIDHSLWIVMCTIR